MKPIIMPYHWTIFMKTRLFLSSELLYTVKGVQTAKWITLFYFELLILGTNKFSLPATFYLLVLFLHMYAHRSNLHHPSSRWAFDLTPLF